MRGLVPLICLLFSLGFASGQQGLPERHSVVFVCGFVTDPPQTLHQWRERADFVIRVRIDSQFAFERHRFDEFTDIITAHDATILDLIKPHRRGLVAGASQQILQMGGRLRRIDHIEVSSWNGFEILPVGSEWVLFLEWNSQLDGFTFFYREHGAVRIKDGRVDAWGGSRLSAWNGLLIDEFIDALGGTRP